MLCGVFGGLKSLTDQEYHSNCQSLFSPLSYPNKIYSLFGVGGRGS